MKCEEFEAIGLGLERGNALANGATPAEWAAAMEHADTCARCAALQESWQEARLGLQALRDTTQGAHAPARVEMRLRQEFRTQHHTRKTRAKLIFAAWTLATAALVFAFVSWWNWHVPQNKPGNEAVAVGSQDATGGTPETTQQPASSLDNLVADNEGDFTLLPGSLPEETQDAAVFRVRLQRGALAEFGFPVNEDRAADWLQVDLLVGQDGQPRAVRLPVEGSE
jgi:hypothetical protein